MLFRSALRGRSGSRRRRDLARRENASDLNRAREALDLQQGKSVLVFSLLASWCNGSTRDSGSLCLGSSPSEAVFLFGLPCYVSGGLLMPKLLRVNDF